MKTKQGVYIMTFDKNADRKIPHRDASRGEPFRAVFRSALFVNNNLHHSAKILYIF